MAVKTFYNTQLNSKYILDLPAQQVSDMESHIARILAKEITIEVDNELALLLQAINGNWTKIRGSIPTPETTEWCKTNLKDEYCHVRESWYFKSDKDATMFSLRWR